MVAVSSWKALGTSVHVLTTNADDLAGAELAVRETVRDVDEACSRFRPDSELSRLNTSSGTRVTVSPLLARALGVALQAARRTDGALDPRTAWQRARGLRRGFQRPPASSLRRDQRPVAHPSSHR
jgi:thiamine biosynthesis lipoprotein ApbE